MAGTDGRGPHRVGIAGVEPLAAVAADPAAVDEAVAGLVADLHRRSVGARDVMVAPLEHRNQDGPEVDALLGEAVLEAGRALLVGALLENALVNEAGEAIGEDVAGHAEPVLELVKPAPAVEDVPDDQERPALAEDLERACNRAVLVLVFPVEHECDSCTQGFITQPWYCAFRQTTPVLWDRRRQEIAMNHIETPLKTKVRPLTIKISESEILADLRYPAPPSMTSSAVPAKRR